MGKERATPKRKPETMAAMTWARSAAKMTALASKIQRLEADLAEATGEQEQAQADYDGARQAMDDLASGKAPAAAPKKAAAKGKAKRGVPDPE